MYKVSKRLYRKLKSLIVYKKTIGHDIHVNRVLVLHDKNLDSDLAKGLSDLKDDFNFTNLDVSIDVLDRSFVNTFDFVLVSSALNGKAHELFKTLKKVKPIAAIYINGNNLPKSKNDFKHYDLLWFESYFFADKLNTDIPKIHALGIDLNKNIEDYTTNTAKHILMSRYRNLSYDKKVESGLKEFYKSPIWDIKYLSNQLQKGFNYFENDIKRRTNYIKSSKNIKAGKNSFFNHNLLITGDEYVEVGSFCSFGKNISIYTSNHDINYPSTQGYIYRKYFDENHPGEDLYNPSITRTKGPVTIKNDVWIGDGVKIMSGVTIGNGACIAAGSIITSDVDDYSVVAGVPAKEIKKRFNPDIVRLLLNIEWWNWSDSKILRNKDFFRLNLNEVTNPENVLNNLK